MPQSLSCANKIARRNEGRRSFCSHVSAEEHQVVFDALTEVKGNALEVDKNGDTLAALFSGKLKLRKKGRKKIIEVLKRWQEDEKANVDEPSGKRSQTMDGETELDEGGLHYGIDVPAAGDTEYGGLFFAQKVKEIGLQKTAASSQVGKYVALLEKYFCRFYVPEVIEKCNETASSGDVEKEWTTKRS